MSAEFLRSIPHLRPRTQLFGAHARVRSAALHATHNFFADLGFLNVNTPLLTGNDCEGAGEAFRVLTLNEIATLRESSVLDSPPPTEAAPSGARERTRNAPHAPGAAGDAAPEPTHFLGQAMYLTVSGQLHAEAAAAGYPRVYTFGTTADQRTDVTRQGRKKRLKKGQYIHHVRKAIRKTR